MKKFLFSFYFSCFLLSLEHFTKWHETCAMKRFFSWSYLLPQSQKSAWGAVTLKVMLRFIGSTADYILLVNTL